MDKGKIAEWLLSLAMERAQAASVVGDLLETDRSRSFTCFWMDVFQTLTATTWRDMKARPLFVVGIAARGTLVQAVLYSSGFFASILLSLLLPGVFFDHHHPTWAAHLLAVFSLTIGSICTGRRIAERSFGSILAICGVMAFLMPLVFNGFTATEIWILSSVQNGAIPIGPFVWDSWICGDFVGLFSCLLGAMVVRQRRPVTNGS